MDNKETVIKAEVAKLIEIAKTKGQLTEEDIVARMEKLEATASEIETVYSALKAENITVVETAPETEDIF